MAKRLFRSRNDRVIAGICGGLGEYFDIDPTIFRIIFVIVAVAGGVSILIYILGMFIIPEEPGAKIQSDTDKPESHKTEAVESTVKKTNRNSSNATGGVILILVGVLFLLNNLLNINVWGNFWPLILVVVGLSIMAKSFNTKD